MASEIVDRHFSNMKIITAKAYPKTSSAYPPCRSLRVSGRTMDVVVAEVVDGVPVPGA